MAYRTKGIINNIYTESKFRNKIKWPTYAEFYWTGNDHMYVYGTYESKYGSFILWINL